jgi:oligoribonuclease
MGFAMSDIVSWPALVWLDLEMTGLDIHKDRILEIACIITDVHLTIIAEKEPLVISCPEDVLNGMDRWNVLHHTQSGLIRDVGLSRRSVSDAEREMLEFIKGHCEYQQAPLCGNSVWVDRLFLKMHMPLLEEYMHYRIVDVSTVKQLVHFWYARPEQEFVKKQSSHRALDDIKESIDELRYYRKHFFV